MFLQFHLFWSSGGDVLLMCCCLWEKWSYFFSSFRELYHMEALFNWYFKFFLDFFLVILIVIIGRRDLNLGYFGHTRNVPTNWVTSLFNKYHNNLNSSIHWHHCEMGRVNIFYSRDYNIIWKQYEIIYRHIHTNIYTYNTPVFVNLCIHVYVCICLENIMDSWFFFFFLISHLNF